MKNALLVTFILFGQEIVLFNGLLAKVHQGEYNVWLIHILFVVATLIDIWAGFAIAKIVKQKYTQGKVVVWANKMSAKFHAHVGKHGRWVSLLVIGHISFPYLNGFIAGWLDMPIRETMLFLFIGNLTTYAFYWAIVLGISAVVPNPFYAFLTIIGVSVAMLFAIKLIKERI